MFIRLMVENDKFIRADLIDEEDGTSENLYCSSYYLAWKTQTLDDMFATAEDSVRFNYPEFTHIPIERVYPE